MEQLTAGVLLLTQEELAEGYARSMLFICGSLVKENPESPDAIDPPHNALLDLTVPLLDFTFAILLSTAPPGGATPEGRFVERQEELDRCTASSYFAIDESCKRLAAAAELRGSSRAALQKLLLPEGTLLKWLPAVDLLEIEVTESLLGLATCLFPPDAVVADGWEEELERQLANQVCGAR
jgi:hypothetical protein